MDHPRVGAPKGTKLPNVHRRVKHSRACYFHLLFLRMYFGFLWTCEGFMTPNTKEERLESQWPNGPLPDADPRRGRGTRPPDLVDPAVYEDEAKWAAYVRGLGKWHAATNMCIPYEDLPPGPIPEGWISPLAMPRGSLPRGWRPHWCIPQRIVVKPKDEFRWKFGERLDAVPGDKLRGHVAPDGARRRARAGRVKWQPEDAIQFFCDVSEEWLPGWVIGTSADGGGGDGPEPVEYDIRVAGPLPKARTVCNFRANFNQYYRAGRFRYCGAEDFVSQLEVGDWISVIDISSYYLKLAMAMRMLKYMVFWDASIGRQEGRDDKEAWLIHTRLPFGASLSCYYAQMVSSEILDSLRAHARRVMRQLKADRRKRSSKKSKARLRNDHLVQFGVWGRRPASQAYVDDLGLGGESKPCVNAARRELLKILDRVGLPAEDKDDTWTPRQEQKYLGVMICTRVEFPPGSGVFVIEMRMTDEYGAYLQTQLEQVLGVWVNSSDDVAVGDTVEARRGGEDRWTRATVVRQAPPSLSGERRFDLAFDTKGRPVPAAEASVPRSLIRRVPEGLDTLKFDRLRSLLGSLSWVSACMHGGRSRLCSVYELKANIEKAFGIKGKGGPGHRAALKAIRVNLEAEVVADLAWFLDKIKSSDWRGAKAVTRQRATPIATATWDTTTVRLKSDASGPFGHGWFQMPAGSEVPPHGQAPWSDAEQELLQHDMVAKELWPAREAARALGHAWFGKLVTFGQDNQGAVYSLCATRARTPAARQIMRDLADLEEMHSFECTGAWVPRELNTVADALSRQLSWEQSIRTLSSATAYPASSATA